MSVGKASARGRGAAFATGVLTSPSVLHRVIASARIMGVGGLRVLPVAPPLSDKLRAVAAAASLRNLLANTTTLPSRLKRDVSSLIVSLDSFSHS